MADEKAVEFETALKKLESIVGNLEGGELSLEQSLEAYEEGVNALKQCYALLKQAEGKIELLTKAGAVPELAEYDEETGAAKEPPRKKKAAEDDDYGIKDSGEDRDENGNMF